MWVAESTIPRAAPQRSISVDARATRGQSSAATLSSLEFWTLKNYHAFPCSSRKALVFVTNDMM